TPDKILGYYRALRTNGTETLLFFYAGHGATDDKVGHYLQLQNGRYNLARHGLRRAMQEKQPGLAVILTDCCSNFHPLRARSAPESGSEGRGEDERGPRETSPVVRNLLFQQRGLVDLTASDNEPSWGDAEQGGIFTRTLAALMTGKPAELDRNKDGF